MRIDPVIVWPIATAAFALAWTLRWARLHRRPAADVPPPGRSMSGRDVLLMCALTLVYAITAFTNLGDDTAPQSFLHYEDANYYALIDLGQEREISRVRYYTGLNTGYYTLQFSTDGETWVTQEADGGPVMTQYYNDLFYWIDADLNGGPARYIRVISGADMYLGEMALYGADGALIPADEFSVSPGAEELFDEQDAIPDEYTFMNGTYFDEVFFPRTALEMIEGMPIYELSHPPLGKAILSLGIRMFGMTPFGWRFMGTLFGVSMLPALYILLKKLFGYTSAAVCGATVFAFDFMHFAQTRLATIDSYSVFFILLMYMFMYFWLTEPEQSGRRLLWLGLSGLSFGLGAATKWICIYAGAGLAVIWAVYWAARFARERAHARAPFFRNVLRCLLFFVAVPALVYYASYWSYGPGEGIDGPFRLFRPDYLRIVLKNQRDMWHYHSTLVAEHEFSSRWYQWLLDARPILYYADEPDGAFSTIAGFSNPLVCWGGLCAVAGLVWAAVRDRDERAIFILIGYFANLLPWVLVSRLTFAYHYFPCTLFLVLALGWIFADLRRRDARWRASVGSFTGACVGLFVMFYPVLSGAAVPGSYYRYLLKWFSTWPFE